MSFVSTIRRTACSLAVFAATIYAEDPASIAPRWSNNETDVSPDGKVTFHGPFASEAVTLDWDALPPHDFVRVELDLLLLRSWDGSVLYVNGRRVSDGPDQIRCSIPGGPILLSTTFSNLPADNPGFIDRGKTQNFPSPVPGDRLAPQTGATAKNTMGYHYPMPGPAQLVPMDATYHLTLLIPHHESTLSLRWEGVGLSGLLDESWGIGDVQLTPLTAAQVPPPDDATIAAAFTNAIDQTSTTQPESINHLIAGMDRTVDWIQANVDRFGLDANAVARAIQDLAGDDNQMAEREGADRTLVDLGPAVEPYLRDARLTTRGEQRFRVERALWRLNNIPIEEERFRRLALATRVLEMINTAAANDLRHRLVRAE